MYLVRVKGKAKVKHQWDGRDTYCRMASTGGLNIRKYQQVEKSWLPLCSMCKTNSAKASDPWRERVNAAMRKFHQGQAERNGLLAKQKG